MNNQKNPNLDLLRMVVGQLEELADEMVFLGGCAAGLLITDTASPPVRVTKDVDTLVQVTTKADYYRLAAKLKSKGFNEDSRKGAPLCRWVAGSLMLDVMPADPSILGFGNAWYEPASRNAILFELDSGRTIQLISAPYFLITKLIAFEGRGRGDFLMSHDLEDLVAIIDGRPGLLEEVEAAEDDLKDALAVRFKVLLNNTRFREAVAGHMPPDESSPARLPQVLRVMEKIAGLPN
jgi:hypothetical protein